MEGRVIILSHLLNAANSLVSWIWSGLEEYVSIYVTITYAGKVYVVEIQMVRIRVERLWTQFKGRSCIFLCHPSRMCFFKGLPKDITHRMVVLVVLFFFLPSPIIVLVQCESSVHTCLVSHSKYQTDFVKERKSLGIKYVPKEILSYKI